MRLEGPWQRLAAALADSSLFYFPLYDRILSLTFFVVKLGTGLEG